jgi:hypothetical protein
MLLLNLDNVEELIFQNREARKLLPEFRQLFDQWKLARMIPSMKNLGRRSVLDFLNSVESSHEKILGSLFGDEVQVDRMAYNIVNNQVFLLDSAEKTLNEGSEWFTNFSLDRDGERLYVCFWR